MTAMTEKDQRRLFAKVGLPDANGCMPWLGARNSRGYGQFRLAGRSLQAHRLMHELVLGPIPAGLEIDHQCGTRECVAPDHLRAITHKQNMENRAAAQMNSSSGVRGVCLRRGRWVARVTHNGRTIHVGQFDRIEEAVEAVQAARDELFTHNDRDRVAS